VAAATTTWQAWESVLPDWKSNKPEAAIPANAGDRTKLAAAVSTAAKTWKPPPTLSVPSLDDLGPDVPRNLHERLALVARLQLAAHLEDAGVDPTVVEFTTTDVTAALSVAGVILNDKGKRTVRRLDGRGGGGEGGRAGEQQQQAAACQRQRRQALCPDSRRPAVPAFPLPCRRSRRWWRARRSAR
jgi:hypothetical protein